MNNTYKCVALVLSTLMPAVSHAVPNVMLEKGQTFVLDNYVRGFQVPTEDSTGVIKYYDVIIKLTVNSDGTLNPIADVAAKASRTISTKALVPGTYKSLSGDTCSITNMKLTNGIIQSFLKCYYADAGNKSELSFASGSISAQHPYYAELLAAGIDKRADVSTQIWGIVTSGYFGVGNCGYYGNRTPIGIKTDGNTLILSAFNKNAFICSGTYTKNP